MNPGGKREVEDDPMEGPSNLPARTGGEEHDQELLHEGVNASSQPIRIIRTDGKYRLKCLACPYNSSSIGKIKNHLKEEHQNRVSGERLMSCAQRGVSHERKRFGGAPNLRYSHKVMMSLYKKALKLEEDAVRELRSDAERKKRAGKLTAKHSAIVNRYRPKGKTSSRAVKGPVTQLQRQPSMQSLSVSPGQPPSQSVSQPPRQPQVQLLMPPSVHPPTPLPMQPLPTQIMHPEQPPQPPMQPTMKASAPQRQPTPPGLDQSFIPLLGLISRLVSAGVPVAQVQNLFRELSETVDKLPLFQRNVCSNVLEKLLQLEEIIDCQDCFVMKEGKISIDELKLSTWDKEPTSGCLSSNPQHFELSMNAYKECCQTAFYLTIRFSGQGSQAKPPAAETTVFQCVVCGFPTEDQALFLAHQCPPQGPPTN